MKLSISLARVVTFPFLLWSSWTTCLAQVLDSPITVPVAVEAEYLPLTTDPAGVYATMGSTPYVYGSVGGTLAWQTVSRVDFDLKPGKDYLLTATLNNLDEVTWHFNPPAGYRVMVEDVDRLVYRDTTATSRTYKVRVLPMGSDDRGLLGEASSLRPVRLLWQVSMGYLRNGQGAGAIELRESTVAAASGYTSLYYDSPSAEVDIRYAVGGHLRQVLAPDGLADVVDLSTYYEIRFYRLADVGSLSGGVYLLTGSPFLTYKVEKPATDHLKITRIRGSRTEITELLKNSSTQWTVQDWTKSTESSQRTVVYDFPSANVEEVTVKNGGTTATRTRKEYASVGGALELTKVTSGYGTVNLVTDYTYFTSSGSPGSYRKLESVTRPDGSWTRFAYYESPIETRGQVYRVFSPYLDDPATAASATPSNSKVVEYLYEADWTGKNRRPFSIATTINGVAAGQVDIDYADSTVNSRPLVTETRTAYEKTPSSSSAAQTTTLKYYREDAPADTFQYWPGRLHSVVAPDGTKRAHGYREGWFDPTTRSFSPNPGDYHIEELIVQGSSNSGAGSAFSSSGYTFDAVYVVSQQSTYEQIVRTRQGAIIYRAQWVHNGSAWVKADGVLSGVEDRKPLYHFHDTGRYSNEWTYTDGRLTQAKDADGIPTTYAYDPHGRVETTTKSSLSAGGGYPSRPAVTTSFSYDADHRLLSRSRGPSSPIVESWAYDTAGRVTSATDLDQGTRSMTYPSAREVTTTLPGAIAVTGGTRTVTESTYRDGRFKERTGNAAVPEYHYYLINSGNGNELRQTKPTAASGDRWHNEWMDWLGRAAQEFTPTYLEPGDSDAINIVDYFYDSGGRVQRLRNWSPRSGWGYSQPLTSDRIFSYDSIGQLSTEARDVNGDGSINLGGTDRVNKSERRFEIHSGNTWFVQRSKVLPTQGSTAERTVQETRSRLTGLSSNQVTQTVTIDAAGASATETVTVDRSARLRTVTTQYSGVSTSASSVWLNGLLYRETSASGVQTTYSHDNWERVSRIAGRGSVEVNLSYIAGKNLIYEKGNVYYTTDRYTYDAAGRVTLHETFNYSAVSGARTGTARFGYNALGQVVQRWGSAVQPVAFEFNAYGECIKMWTYPTGSSWASSTTWPGGSGNLTEWIYQAKTGLLTEKRDANGRSSLFEYNLRHQLSKRTQQRGSSDNVVTDYLYYDSVESSDHVSYRTGALKTVDYPGTTQDLTYFYDRLDRVVKVNEQATGGDRSFSYRDTTDLQLAHEDLPAFFGSSQRLVRNYESSGVAGRYLGFSFGPTSGTALHNTSYTFSASTGRLDTVEKTGHIKVNYGYLSGSNHVSSVTIGEWYRGQTWETGREAVSTLTQNWTGSGLRSVAQYTSDFDWRLNRDAVTLTGELATPQGHANGLKTQYWNFLSGDSWDREELRETKTLTLDTSTELTTRYRKWSYDAAQNRTQENRTGGWSTTYANNALDQLTGLSGSQTESFAHNWAGNLTSDGTWNYTFDAENQLIKLQQHTGGTLRLEFVYDYLGRRIEKAVYANSTTSTASKKIRYVYDGWNLVAELDALNANAVLRTYTWGLDASETLQGAGGVGGLLRMEEGGNKYYPIYDPSHNVTGLLRDDGSTSTLVASYLYGPFGEKLATDWAASGFTDNNPFRFSTKYTDTETGFVYFGLRYYDPKTGRFMGRDPIEERGGINLYGFVSNNPVNRSDYLGLESMYQDGSGGFTGGQKGVTNNSFVSLLNNYTDQDYPDGFDAGASFGYVGTRRLGMPSAASLNAAAHLATILSATAAGAAKAMADLIEGRADYSPVLYGAANSNGTGMTAGGSAIPMTAFGVNAQPNGSTKGAIVAGVLATVPMRGTTIVLPRFVVTAARFAGPVAAVAAAGHTGYQIGTWIDNKTGFSTWIANQIVRPTVEDAAKAPGLPSADDGFIPKKNWDGKKVPNPNGGGYGYPDVNGNVWVPTGTGPLAHGGPHWDVQIPGGGYKNVRPGGRG